MTPSPTFRCYLRLCLVVVQWVINSRQEKRDSLFELKRVNNYKCTKVKLVNERIVK